MAARLTPLYVIVKAGRWVHDERAEGDSLHFKPSTEGEPQPTLATPTAQVVGTVEVAGVARRVKVKLYRGRGHGQR